METVNQHGKKLIIENPEKIDLKLPPLVKVEQMSLLVGPKQKITNQTEIIEILDKDKSVTNNPVLLHTIMMKIANYSQFRETVLFTKILVNIDVLSQDFLQVPKNKKERILFDLTTNTKNKIVLDYEKNIIKTG